MLGLLGVRALGRRKTAACLVLLGAAGFSGWAWAAYVLDGEPGEWSVTNRLGTDADDDAPEATDLRMFFAKQDGSTLCLRVDTDLAFDSPPQAVDDSFGVAEDDPETVLDVLANDVDLDGGLLEVVSVTQPSGGTVSITNAGSDLAYVPDPDLCNDGTPSDDFTYTVNGGSTATVSVSVTCVDDPPVAADDSYRGRENQRCLRIDHLENDTDPDGGPLQFEIASDVTKGTLFTPDLEQEVSSASGWLDPMSLCFVPYPYDYSKPPGSEYTRFTYRLNPGGSMATASIIIDGRE